MIFSVVQAVGCSGVRVRVTRTTGQVETLAPVFATTAKAQAAIDAAQRQAGLTKTSADQQEAYTVALLRSRDWA